MCGAGGRLITSPGAGSLGSQLSHPGSQRLGWNMGSQGRKGMMLEILRAVVSGLRWQRAPGLLPHLNGNLHSLLWGAGSPEPGFC